jgi:2-(1,2-epoxy-1,2-dihydrophenyl)acetyl-CoA isomerase
MEDVMKNIRTTRDGAVGIITIDRPERFNSFDVITARDLRKAALAFAREVEVRAVVLRGTNGVFSSGADLKYIKSGGEREELGYLHPGAREVPAGFGEIFKQILEYLHSTISEIRRAPKPFIAAVDGVAAAGGMGLALCCDLVIASARSTFEYAYFKTALTGAESNTFFLPKLIGLRKTLDMAFLNPRFSAVEAERMGLISRAVPNERFEEEVREMASHLASGPTASYAAAKQLFNLSAGGERLDYHLDCELETLARSADSKDFEEGIAAFFEKRAAAFEGE